MKLNRNQKEAVETTERNVLVVACAGSGKTRVLTERIRHLLVDKHEDPYGIVAITLTNQAADEISSRLCDVPGINKVFIGTIHSMAYNILRYLGYDFKILTDDLDYELHLELINKYCRYLTEKDYKKYRTQLLSYKLGLIGEAELLRSLSHESLSELKWIEGDITSKSYPETIGTICRSRNIIQFDDLLRFVISSGAKININHLLVDEFQDIGTLEYKFISSFNSKCKFYVGDDWQSIYSFRGSNLQIFKSLYKDSKFKTYTLYKNYRSGKSIIDLSNKIIRYNHDRIMKGVKPVTEADGEIACVNDSELYRILESIKEKGNFKDWFVLARSNKDVVYLSTVLQNHGIPYSIFRREGMSGNDIKVLMYNNTVKLMTIHASKGLESDNVLLYGTYSDKVVDTCKRMKEEEVRVFYVAVTRARKKLLIVNKSSFMNNINLDDFTSLRSNEGPVLRITGVYGINEGNARSVMKTIKAEMDAKHADCLPEDPMDIQDEDGNYLFPTLEEIEKHKESMYEIKAST